MKVFKISSLILLILIVGFLSYTLLYQQIVNKGSAVIHTTKGNTTQVSPTNTSNSNNMGSLSLEVSQDTIKFLGEVLDTKKSFPLFLFSDSKIYHFYTDTLINDFSSGKDFLRVDEMVFDRGSFNNRVTAFYVINFNDTRTHFVYTRVLATGEKQASTPFSTVDILSQNPLTVHFSYDIAQPLECYGDGCRSIWEEEYVWNAQQNKFIPIDWDYKTLYQKYLKMDAKGCSFGDIEGKGLKTLQAVYDIDNTDYCGNKDLHSSRQELNKFIQAKQQLETLINK